MSLCELATVYLCVISGLLRSRCQDRIICVRDLLGEEAGKGRRSLIRGYRPATSRRRGEKKLGLGGRVADGNEMSR